MGVMSHFMLGTEGITKSIMLDPDKNVNLTTKNSSIFFDGDDIDEKFDEGDLSKSIFSDKWKIPNMLYCPENIFANKIAALDVNFIHPNSYTNAYGEDVTSGASEIAPTIASWYKAFRNIAVVGLLCVLVYLGIRILIETSVQGKAKYKESLKDWFVALCLIFAMHLIMAGTLMIIEKVTELVSESVESEIHVQVGDNIKFKTNLTGYVRLKAQGSKWDEIAGYTVIYFALVIYTGIFTVMYLKRFLYMAFLTMISPLVALTYPMDKAGDGKAQAFNMWFKEYLMHAILQPVHLLLYTALVGSAINLAKENVIYALVAIGFLIPAEKLIKKMFKLDQGQTTSGFGSIAASAVTMSALSKLASKPPIPGKGGNGGKIGDGMGKESDSSGIRKVDRSTLGSFQGESDGKEFLNNKDAAAEEKNNNNLLGGEGPDNSMNAPNDFQKNEIGKLNGNDDGNNYPLKNVLNNAKSGLDNVKNGISDKWNNSSLKYNLDNTNAGRTARAIGKTAIRGIRREFTGKKLKRKLTGGAKLLARGTAATAGLFMGFGAGVATGEASNVFKMGGAGLMAGNLIGKNTADTLGNMGNIISDGVENFRNDYEVEKYGISGANERQVNRQNARAKKDFLQDEAERQKYMQMAADMEKNTGKSYNVDELMNKAFDYKVAGIDDSKIQRGLELEDKYDHEQVMDAMALTGKYGNDYVLDDKKRSSMEEYIKTKISNPQQQREAMQLFAETHGLGSFYDMKSTLGSTTKNNTKGEQRLNTTKSGIVTGGNGLNDEFRKLTNKK